MVTILFCIFHSMSVILILFVTYDGSNMVWFHLNPKSTDFARLPVSRRHYVRTSGPETGVNKKGVITSCPHSRKEKTHWPLKHRVSPFPTPRGQGEKTSFPTLCIEMSPQRVTKFPRKSRVYPEIKKQNYPHVVQSATLPHGPITSISLLYLRQDKLRAPAPSAPQIGTTLQAPGPTHKPSVSPALLWRKSSSAGYSCRDI